MIAVLVIGLPQTAVAGVSPVDPGAMVQAGMAAAQRALDGAAAVTGSPVPLPSLTGAAAVSAPTARRAAAPSSAAAVAVASAPGGVTAAAPPTPARGAPSVALVVHHGGSGPRVRISVPVVRPSVPVAAPHVSAPERPRISAPHPPRTSAPAPPRLPAPAPPRLPAPAPPRLSAPAAALVPGVDIAPIVLPSFAHLAALAKLPAPTSPVLPPALGILTLPGWPLSLVGISLPGVAPPPPGTVGARAFSMFAASVGAPRAMARPRPARPAAQHRTLRAALAAAESRRPADALPASWVGGGGAGFPLASPAGSESVSSADSSGVSPGGLQAQRPLTHRGTRPGAAHPPAGPVLSAPPISSPVAGGGAAAGGAGTGGGGAAASLVTAAALLLLFVLSARVSLDLSAWRSTLLSLRLERPG